VGTQQLLLIILGAIVVGISVVIGITIFGKSTQESNTDAVIEDCLRLGTQAQEYFLKPKALGGGGQSFTGITLGKCGWKNATNANGTYSFYRVYSNRVRIQGMGKNNVRVRVYLYSDSVGNPSIVAGMLP
jgi:hypothetical protein